MKKVLALAAIVFTLIVASSYVWMIDQWDKRNEWWVVPSYTITLVIVATVTWLATKYGWSQKMNDDTK